MSISELRRYRKHIVFFQLVPIPISSDVEVVNVSTTGTDVTAVLIVEMAPMKSAVCIALLITAYHSLYNTKKTLYRTVKGDPALLACIGPTLKTAKNQKGYIT